MLNNCCETVNDFGIVPSPRLKNKKKVRNSEYVPRTFTPIYLKLFRMYSAKPHNKALGLALRKQRKKEGFSQEQLALRCNLDRTYISILELGTSSPTLDTIFSLCLGLNITLSQFAIEIENHLGNLS